MTPSDHGDDDWDDADESAAFDHEDYSDLDAFADHSPAEEESPFDAFDAYPVDTDNFDQPASSEDVNKGFADALRGDPDQDNDVQIPVAQATNSQGTVNVVAYLNGSVALVNLEPSVTGMTEQQLAQEIQAVADVAAKKATTVIHVLAVRSLVDQGMDFDEARDFISNNTWFASPEDAQAAVDSLATRDTGHLN